MKGYKVKMKSLIIYWSAGGNTKKVADSIEKALLEKNIEVDIMKITEMLDVDLFQYDLVFLGSPSYQFLPPENVIKYIKKNLGRYGKVGVRELRAPKKPNKYAVVFCTYSGVHTGIKEAYTAGKYIAQFFEHLGFLVFNEWYIVGKFHGREEVNKYGKLGDISDRPNKQDLDIIYQETIDLLKGLGV